MIDRLVVGWLVGRLVDEWWVPLGTFMGWLLDESVGPLADGMGSWVVHLVGQGGGLERATNARRLAHATG